MSELKRTLGLPALCFYAIGMILGAGIYSVVGKAAGIAGYGLWLSFAIGAAAAGLTGLSYAELATAFPKAGAEYVYLREAVPRWRAAPAIVGIVLAISGAATAATVSFAFAGYLKAFVQLPAWVVVLALLVLMTAVGLTGIKTSAWVNAVFTVIEIGGLVVVIALGVTRPELGRGALTELGPGVLPATALAFFSFLGFEEVANLAEEARDPGRDVPRAIIAGIVVSAVLYVLVAFAVTALLAPAALAASDSPLAAAVAVVSAPAAGILGGVALFATANTGLIALVVTSRLVFSMARGGDLPRPLARVLPGRGTPWVAALVTLALAAAFLPLGKLEIVASVSSFAALLAFLAVNGCVIVLRYRKPDLDRPFRVPVAVGRLPVLPALGAVATLVLVTQFGLEVYLWGAGAIGAGLAVYLAGRVRARRKRSPRRS